MKVKIQSVHFDADRKLTEFIEARMSKLNHFLMALLGLM